jgi:serine/threonine protein kinase
MDGNEPIASPLRSVNGYEILELIASGGMSRVYRARNAKGETVAVKVIQFDEMAADYERRLRREPEVQRGVGHDNIVRLIDWFRVGGEFFLVMEYVDGRSLWRIIRDDGALPFERARTYLRQLLPAVAHLHDLGIIHRDIKPANILVATDDTAKLADFGIAKFTWQQGQTRTQQGVGTPEYMSPEQARGVGIDQRTDIYSLGITFYEMLTGRPPFSREQETPAAYSEIIQGILSQQVPDPRTVQPDVPGGAAAFIARATAKDPKDRYSTAAQMLRALDAIATDDNGPSTIVIDRPQAQAAASAVMREARDAEQASTSSRPLSRRPLAIGLILVLLVGAAIAATQLYSPDDTVSAGVERKESPAEIAQRVASSYRQYSRSHSLEPLAALYAPDSVEYLGHALLSRDSILGELREDYRRLARTDSFAVEIDSARALGDTAIAVTWRTHYARTRSDSSRFSGSTHDELRFVRHGERWLIAEHDRRLLTGDAPDGPEPRRVAVTAPSRSSSVRAERKSTRSTAAPTQRSTRPIITVRVNPGVRFGKNGKGPKAKKRRH